MFNEMTEEDTKCEEITNKLIINTLMFVSYIASVASKLKFLNVKL